MKKFLQWFVSVPLVAGIFSAVIGYFIMTDKAGIYTSKVLPAHFPGQTAMIYFWVFILLCMCTGMWLITLRQTNINRKKNAVIDVCALMCVFACWAYMLFMSGRFNMAITFSICEIIIFLVVNLIFYLMDHRASYMLIPGFLWTIFTVYLSFAIKSLN